jgi:hypothetical protein
MSDWRFRCRPNATRHHHPRQVDNESRQVDFVNGLLKAMVVSVAAKGGT